MAAFLRKFVFFLVLVFVLVFCFQNMENLSTQVRFHFDLFVPGQVYETPSLPVFFLLGLLFLMGMLAAGFFGFYEKLARQLDIRKRDRRIRELEQEVAALRTQLESAVPAPSLPGEQPSRGSPSTPLLEDNPTL